MRLALIEGLPMTATKDITIYNDPETNYSWDSEWNGVPEFRRHCTSMIRTIRYEHPRANVMVIPFYPKYTSMKKNYKLLAKCIVSAVNSKANIVCICMEVLHVKYLSSEMRKAYEYAYANGVLICVSGGNTRPLNNPLIHWKYTTPVVGVVKGSTLERSYQLEHLEFNDANKRRLLSKQKNYKVLCSKATAQYCARIAKGQFSHQIAKEIDQFVLMTYN